MESEVSELPKGLVLWGGEHVHIRHITPSSLVGVGSNICILILHFIHASIFHLVS